MKKIFAAILCACILTALALPASAIDTTSAADQLRKLGILKGNDSGVTDEYLSSSAQRIQGAVIYLRTLGLEQAALAYSGTEKFNDSSSVEWEGGKRLLAYLKAHPELGFTGTGGNNFSPKDKLTAQQYYKILLTSLGYRQDSDFTWQDTLTFAQSHNLADTGAFTSTQTLTMNDVSKITRAALTAPVNGGTETLISRLVSGGTVPRGEAEELGLLPAPPEAQAPAIPAVPTAPSSPITPPPITIPTVAAPTIHFLSFDDYSVAVSVYSVTPSATIYYTYSLGGAPATPTAASSSVPSGAIVTIENTNGHTVKLNAIAAAAGMNNSPVTSFTYDGFVIESVDSGVATLSGNTLTITNTLGMTTAGSLLGAIHVSAGATVNVYPNNDCYGNTVDSNAPILSGYAVKVTSGTDPAYFTIYNIALPKAQTPTATTALTQSGETYTVTLTSQPGSKIYYTVNDDAAPFISPDTYEYTGTMTLAAGTRIKAIAVVEGMDNSEVLELTLPQ